MKRFVSVLLVLVMCITSIPLTVSAQRDFSTEEILAQQLKDLGLFRGVSETDFDLERAPTRVEALVMLIRVLGKEGDVTSDTWKHPFTDVPGWADNYVGYAYSKGLTDGQSDTTFGTGDASAAMYLTFVLRALGYSDADAKDFTWDNPYTLAKQTGILTNQVDTNNFLRADVVLVSHAALSSYLKGSNQTLAQKLISAGVIAQNKFNSVYNNGTSGTKPSQTNEFTAEEIYALCSPAVFYIELYDKNGTATSSGSGFFIDNKGTAITNYHVIENAYSAKIQLSDTQAVYNVVGVYDYNEAQDWAVIKIDCTGNQFLNIESDSKVVGGQRVFTIGSPLGLQNTISEGIISNPARVLDGVTYIQTNAAISHGSSGGALINTNGNVVGITSAIAAEGQNLNIALPVSYVDGCKTNSITALSSMFPGTSNNTWAGSDTSRKEQALTLLKAFVLENYQEYDKELCWYKFELEFEKENGKGTEFYQINYDYEDDSLIVAVIDLYTRSHCFSYYFYIELDEKYSSSYYYYDEYTDSGFEEVTKGSAYIDISKFSSNYNYTFCEYAGDDRANDEEISVIMHSDGLDFVNLIFEYCAEYYGYYDVTDLGYTTYKKQEEPQANITYTLNVQNIDVYVGETKNIEVNFTYTGFPDDVDFYVETTDSNIADADWDYDDHSLPWTIIINGVSPGTTYLKVGNSFNDQYITIPITVSRKAHINYTLSHQSVSINSGDSFAVSLEYDYIGFPDDFNLIVETGNQATAKVTWAEENEGLLRQIIIKGISEGTTYLKVSNDFNDQYIAIPVKVLSNPSVLTDAVYNNFVSAKFPLRLYSNDGKTFLGELTTDKYDSDSFSNTYGSYGSKYSDTSIFNEYGIYGSTYGSQSAFNKYASSPPIILDSNGKFIAYLTANTYKTDGISYYELMVYLERCRQ